MTFRLRLNHIDWYHALPTSLDPHFPPPKGQKNPPKIPIIRVFGRTETGQKVCAHLHGAFPYIYIEYPTAEAGLIRENINGWLRLLRRSLDKALNQPYDAESRFTKPKPYVANISLVKGVPFYGFHVGWKYYAKIYLFNPRHMKRLSMILQSGGVMGTVFQPYEAHIQYILQFMIDYNLYGCGFIECEKVYFRQGVPDIEVAWKHTWHNKSIPQQAMLPESEFQKQSYCELEVDIQTQDIINRREVSARELHHNFIERLNPTPPDKKLLHSLAELWKDENRRRSSANQLDMEEFVVSSGTREPGTDWMHEEDNRNKILAIMQTERQKGDGSKPQFENFVHCEPLENKVQTALESVGDFFSNGSREILAHEDEGDDHRVDINEQAIGELDEEDFGWEAGDDELAEIDKEIFDLLTNGEEDEAGQGLIARPIDKKGKGKELVKEPGEESDEPMKDIPMTLDEYGHSECMNQNLSDPSIQTHSQCYYDSNTNFDTDPPDYLFEVPSKFIKGPEVKVGKGHRKGPNDELEDNGYKTPGNSSTQLKRKDPPGVSGYKPPKSRKIEIADEKAIGSSKTYPSSASSQSQSKIEAKNGLENTRVPAPKPTSSLVDSDKVPPSPSMFSPGTWDFPALKTKTLRLSQEISSQEVHQEPRASAENATQHILGLDKSILQLSMDSGVEHAAAQPKIIPSDILSSFQIGQQGNTNSFIYNSRFPCASELVTSPDQYDTLRVEYQEPFYGNEKDVPKTSRSYGGREFRLKSKSYLNLPEFDPMGENPDLKWPKELQVQPKPSFKFWQTTTPLPRRKDAVKWLLEQKKEKGDTDFTKADPGELDQFSQLDGPTQKNKYGWKFSQKQRSNKIQSELQPMSIMSLEVHVNTRGKFVPDPSKDPIVSIFWCLQSNEDHEDLENNGIKDGFHVGILTVDETTAEQTARNLRRQYNAEVNVSDTEIGLVQDLIDIVRKFDPDILTGYEVHSSSWGYIIERAQHVWEMDLCDNLSRVRSDGHGRFGQGEDSWGFNHAAAIRITGRHMINIWRAMRGELNLLGYTIENVAFHLLHRRIPHYPFETLTKWHKSGRQGSLTTILKYYLLRVQLNLEIIDQQELVSRTSEQARILGVDFHSVFSRGSQFKVESLMFRIAKPENFILVSPSRRQVGSQNALECLPLVMEPQSEFYTSPVVVLDFTSLYPSIMIAYNYCYSTFLGRVDPWNGQDKMGFTNYKRTPKLLELCKDYINIAPNGMMYVKPEIRKSLLAKMLAEILDTRVMVKNGMKRDKDDKTLHKLLNNRQLALKLIANVTYGYTSASFSGRMPCAEIADSIVQTGRETLERAKIMIENEGKWDAEVVYGDTDSLFIHLKGRTKDQAFTIGEEITARVTAMNPEPIKLKFEKVYHPCVLLAKKRYVGFKYEYRDQKEPDFDAKGIETVRRDGNPAVQKMEEKVLKILFRTSDLSQVKSYFQAQCSKIMKGTVSIQDFTIAKEVKLGNYAEGALPPPGARLALERMKKDPRNEPQHGERYPFVVVAGGPMAKLSDKSVEVEILLHSSHLSLDSEYYITKTIIPPLERIFNLVGANVRQWYEEMPKYQGLRKVTKGKPDADDDKASARLKTLESYLGKSTTVCAVCEKKAETRNFICWDCTNESDLSVYKLQSKLTQAEKRYADIQAICRSCSRLPSSVPITCESQACPVYYSRVRQASMLTWEMENIEPLLKTLESVKKQLEW